MKYKELHFSGHAVVQMFRRGIQVNDIEVVLETGKLIKDYPEDKPLASFLMLGFIEHRPLHVVASTDKQGNCFIITAYEPDVTLWNDKFTSKK
jgi:hypothetical protein